MATIGRMDAVANVKWPFKAHMSGFPAWVTWLTVHIFFLIGFRNRLSVLAAGSGPTSPSRAARASSPATSACPAGRTDQLAQQRGTAKADDASGQPITKAQPRLRVN